MSMCCEESTIRVSRRAFEMQGQWRRNRGRHNTIDDAWLDMARDAIRENGPSGVRRVRPFYGCVYRKIIDPYKRVTIIIIIIIIIYLFYIALNPYTVRSASQLKCIKWQQ